MTFPSVVYENICFPILLPFFYILAYLIPKKKHLLIFIYSVIRDVEHNFLYLLAICIFLIKCLFMVFVHYSLECSISILRTLFFANKFSLSLAFPCLAEIFNYYEVISIFCFGGYPC